MLASVELPADFKALNRQFRDLAQALLDELDLLPDRVEVTPTRAGNFRSFDGSRFYRIDSGTITVRYRHRNVCLLEEGDLLLPDIAGAADPDAAVTYGSEAGASLSSYPALDFMQRVFSQSATTKQWTRLLVTYSGMMLRLAAAATAVDVVTTPGFEVYEPGDIIIAQGDRAHFVFNMTEGVADVLVDGVQVGRISAGEIFGAMAALTHADRSATVRARTHCSVVKVPTNQFAELIRSNPATIQGLLSDMANSIVSLNEQLVRLQGGDARK
jgi:CRP-like cAMP-binding protein